MPTLEYDDAFARARRRCAFNRLFFTIAVVLVGGSYARAADANVVPEAVCVEYYTAPVTGAIGANYISEAAPGAFGTTGTTGYIAHFAYLSTEAQNVTIPKGIATNNFFAPGTFSFSGQPSVFSPGHSSTFKFAVEYRQITWFLGASSATVTPIGFESSGQEVPPSPTCAPSFLPSTSLSYSQPGTYTQQYLGQVDSGPAAATGSQFVVTALSGNPNVTLSNLTYVPNDSANPVSSLNPNSIYADITIGYGGDGPNSVHVQLSANGTAVMKGLTAINYTGPQEEIQTTGGTPQSAQVGSQFASTLQAKVTDTNNNPVTGVMVTFAAPTSGASATLSTPALTDVNGLTSVTATANGIVGSYTVTASVNGASTSANFSLTNVAGPAASLMISGGNNQSATAGGVFSQNLQVTITDGGGNPVPNVIVTFTAPTGPGISTGTFTGGLSTAQANTNSSGIATAPAFTANTKAGGPYMVSAAASNLTAVNFSLSNTAGPATQMNANGSTALSVQVMTQTFPALGVTVFDANQNPVPGVQVTFTAPAGSGIPTGTFTGGLSTVQVNTNGSGSATAPTVTANTKAGGPYTVSASASNLTTVNFSLTNTAGAASTMTANSSTTPQSAAVGNAFTTALAVTVADIYANPVPGLIVTFAAPTGAGIPTGTFTGTTAVATGTNGIAMAPTFTANLRAGGPYMVTAMANGLATVNFSLTNVAGPAASMIASSGTIPQSAVVTQTFGTLLAVTVTDSNSNPVQGVTVTFTAPPSGASGVFANTTNTTQAMTNASGIATATAFKANTKAGGPYAVTAAATGLTTVNFSLTNLAGPAASMMANPGTTPQSAPVTQAFGTLLAVTVTDSYSNPVQGVTVTFTAPASGASGVFANTTNTTQAMTNTAGVATATTFTANATVGGPYNVIAGVTGVSALNFSLTNLTLPPVNVTSQVSVTGTGFVRDRATGIWASTMTITNTGGKAIAGPIQVILTSLTTGVTMTNNTGIETGSPYITITAGTLAAGGSASIAIQFTNPANSFIQFTPVIYSGYF